MRAAVKFPLLTQVVLTRDISGEGWKKGDVVTVVDHHPSPKPGVEDGYSLEVFNAVGDTIAVTVVPVGWEVTDIEVALQPPPSETTRLDGFYDRLRDLCSEEIPGGKKAVVSANTAPGLGQSLYEDPPVNWLLTDQQRDVLQMLRLDDPEQRVRDVDAQVAEQVLGA